MGPSGDDLPGFRSQRRRSHGLLLCLRSSRVSLIRVSFPSDTQISVLMCCSSEMVGLCIPAACEVSQQRLLTVWSGLAGNASVAPVQLMYNSPQRSHYDFLEPIAIAGTIILGSPLCKPALFRLSWKRLF